MLFSLFFSDLLGWLLGSQLTFSYFVGLMEFVKEEKPEMDIGKCSKAVCLSQNAILCDID